MPTFLEVTFVIFLMCVDNNGMFSSVLKHPNITTVFKMGYRGSKVQFLSLTMLIDNERLYNIWAFTDELRKTNIYQKLLKWANKKQNKFNIYNATI